MFDDAGNVADAVVTQLDPSGVSVRVETIRQARHSGELIVASAVPKGDRADWMIEKLSELGVSRFIPLQTERSVVHPTGSGKRDRWIRIATESAKQSRRAGVMQIDDLTGVEKLLPRDTGLRPVRNAPDIAKSPPLEHTTRGPEARVTGMWFLSTEDDATDLKEVVGSTVDELTLFIGPEGGWADQEISRFKECGLTGVKLTATILRVETAAIAAAAIAATMVVRR